MFQIKNADTNEIVNVYQVETVCNELGDVLAICAIVYGKERGWDSIELSDDWEPTDIPNSTQPLKKNPWHTPRTQFGIGGVDDPVEYDRGYIPVDNKLSI